MNEKALEKFIAHLQTAQTYLDEIQTAIDDHMGEMPEDVNWGNVGDAAYLVELLRAIVNQMNGVDDE